METQIRKNSRLTIERGESETLGYGVSLDRPYTGRDMYNSLSPDVFRNIFEPAQGNAPAATQYELNPVPTLPFRGSGFQGSGTNLEPVTYLCRLWNLVFKTLKLWPDTKRECSKEI
jgi:hypothetical protein